MLTVKWSILFSDKKIDFLKDILDENGNIKTWENLPLYKIYKLL